MNALLCRERAVLDARWTVPVKATVFSREVWDKSSHKPAKETVRTMRLESQKQLEGRAVHMVYAFA
jgi:hypothetical protein